MKVETRVFIKESAGYVFKDRCLAKLKEGSTFGEACLFENMRRTATIRAITDAKLAVLSKVDFQEVL